MGSFLDKEEGEGEVEVSSRADVPTGSALDARREGGRERGRRALCETEGSVSGAEVRRSETKFKEGAVDIVGGSY